MIRTLDFIKYIGKPLQDFDRIVTWSDLFLLKNHLLFLLYEDVSWWDKIGNRRGYQWKLMQDTMQ